MAIIALVNDTWFTVDRIAGTVDDGPAWFIAPGTGFDIHRLVVHARSAEDALEIAEETWPWHFFDELDPTDRQEAIRHEEDTGELPDDVYPVTPDQLSQPLRNPKGPWLAHRNEDIRILTRAKAVDRFARKVDPFGRDYRLRTGEVVEVR